MPPRVELNHEAARLLRPLQAREQARQLEPFEPVRLQQVARAATEHARAAPANHAFMAQPPVLPPDPAAPARDAAPAPQPLPARAAPPAVEMNLPDVFPQRLVDLLNEARGRAAIVNEVARWGVRALPPAVQGPDAAQPPQPLMNAAEPAFQVEPAAPEIRFAPPPPRQAEVEPEPAPAPFARAMAVMAEIQQLHARQVLESAVRERQAHEARAVGAPAIERALIDRNI